MEIRRLDHAPLPEASGVAMALLHDGSSVAHVRVDHALIDAGGSLPKHPAGVHQTFVVLSGSGRVAGDDDVQHPVGAGSVVTWAAGEQHTSWADTLMSVVIIQRRPLQGDRGVETSGESPH